MELVVQFFFFLPDSKCVWTVFERKGKYKWRVRRVTPVALLG